jgi:ATP synthase protein I
MPKIDPNERKKILRAASLMTQLAVGMICCIGISVFIGYMLDRWLDTSPVFILIFIFFGVTGAFKFMYDTARRAGG